MPTETEQVLQNVLQAIVNYIDQHKNSKENPHTVTAAQTGAYTKEETNEAINQKIVEIGGGDMQQAVYDPTGQRKDIFAEIANQISKAMLVAVYDPTSQKKDIFAVISANAPMYTALYRLDDWTDADEDAKSKGYAYQQTVTLTPNDPKSPTVTTGSKFLPQMGTPKTGVAETDGILKEALNIIADGVTSTGAGTVTTLVREKPTTDIPVVWTLRTEV